MLQTPFSWTDQNKAKAFELYADGASIDDMASHFSIDRTKVSVFLSRHREQCPLRPNEFWTDAAVETLRDMVAHGHTYSEIGKVLGCTPNSALGKADRLGIRIPRRGAHAVMTDAKPRKPSGRLRDLTGMGMQVSRDQAFRGYRHAGKTVGDAVPVAFHQLAGFQCKWILNDMQDADTPESLCCGAEIVRGSYCEHHASLAYQPRKSGAQLIMDRRARA